MAQNTKKKIDPKKLFAVYDETGKRITYKGPIEQRELEEFLAACEQLRLQGIEERKLKDERRTPEQREALRRARAQEDRLEELRDIMIRDKRRIFPKYTEIDLIKKIISLGRYGNGPEVLELFEIDETGKMSFENMKHVSDMLGPYVCRIDLDIPGFGNGAHTFDSLFTLPEMIDKVQECISDMEREFDAT